MYVTFQEKTWELLKNKIHYVTHQNVMAAGAFDYWFVFCWFNAVHVNVFFLIDDL